MSEVELTAWLSAGYALALLLIAYGIDLLAKRAHKAHDGQQTQGFVYHQDHDAWLCPEDQWLWPRSFDPGNRVMRYRGSPTVCNACPVKDSCTSSDDGRELGRLVDSWPSSESARFHRGIACAATVLAVLWPVVACFTVESVGSQVVLLATAATIAILSIPLWSHLRHSPVDPDGVLFKTLEENLEDRALSVEALQRRQTSYGSDRRPSARAVVGPKLPHAQYASDRRDVDNDVQ